MKFTQQHIEHLNAQLRGIPTQEIIAWAIDYAKRPVVTTNFGPYAGSILDAVTEIKNDIPVIWCDTGYNTPNTYQHAEELIEKLDLHIEDSLHSKFTEQVKLEPFRRAMKEHQPDVWFTNIRKGQTAFRDTLNILSLSKDGVLKVSPFYHWNDAQLDVYLEQHNIPNEHRYFDPTKVLQNRECGIHV
jgi:phosphoadenosine phosphosulfate reductase